MSQFVFIQWVAPFLSEFPEKTSAFAWARRVTRAPVALMNMVSSNINQWGVLSALLAVIYCWSHGSTEPLPFDEFQRHEILLTILQAFLGWIFLASMSLAAYEAVGPLRPLARPVPRPVAPRTRCSASTAPGSWSSFCSSRSGRKKITAFRAFARAWKGRR